MTPEEKGEWLVMLTQANTTAWERQTQKIVRALLGLGAIGLALAVTVILLGQWRISQSAAILRSMRHTGEQSGIVLRRLEEVRGERKGQFDQILAEIRQLKQQTQKR